MIVAVWNLVYLTNYAQTRNPINDQMTWRTWSRVKLALTVPVEDRTSPDLIREQK